MTDMNMFGSGFDAHLIRFAIFIVIDLFGGALLLHLGTGILRFEKRKFTRAFGVVLLGDIVLLALSFYPFGALLSFFVFLYLIKKFYDVGWIMAFLAFLMSIVVVVLITIIVFLILGITIFVIPSI